MNIYKKCSICGEHFKLSGQGGELVMEKHLREVHPKEYQEMLRLQSTYTSELDKLDVLYCNRRAVFWFDTDTKGEWKKAQPVKQRPMDELLALMRAGWEVGSYEGWAGCHISAQESGLGKGGKTKNYSRNVINALLKRGLIKRIDKKGFPIQIVYVLTQSGRGENK